MPRMNELAQKIRDLPAIDEKRDQLKIVRDVRQQASTVLDVITRITRQAPFVEALTTNRLLIKSVAESAASMKSEATKLIRLTNRANFGKESAISAALEALKRPLPRVTKSITDAWDAVRNRASAFDEISAIASQLRLANAAKLQASIATYRRVTSQPPESEEQAEAVKIATRELEGSVATSGLSGDVGALLVGAAREDGDARLLLSKEVQQFLVEHPGLWLRLRVKLG